MWSLVMISVDRIYHQADCSICLAEYERENGGNDCVLLRCGHIYHRTCFDRWYEQQNNCPNCRSVVHLPVLLKDATKKVLAEGLEGVKQGLKWVRHGVVASLAYFVGAAVAHYQFPANRVSSEEWDAYRERHDFGEPIYDLRDWSGYIKLGVHAAVLTAGVGTYHILKEVRRQRNAYLLGEGVYYRNYVPPEN